jgi:hypothetical protein
VTNKEGQVSIIIIPDGGAEPRSYSVSRRWIRVLVVSAGLIAAGIVAMAGSWAAIARRAARADDLVRQNDSLLARHGRMDSLVRRLEGIEAQHDNVRLLLGVDGLPDSAFWRGGARSIAFAEGTGLPEESGSEPTAWPLTTAGVITQSGGADADHPGIDIAVASDSYVLASGGGEVVDAANDPVYGLFVLIDHGNGWRTRYGHASFLVAERGRKVRRGEVIAISGSTGRSTAPHLHFEILENGRPIDPLAKVTPPQ